MIYGEALAARALLHFELLRLFAAAPVVDLTAKAIPIRRPIPTRFRRAIRPRCSKKIIADFEAALPLLAVNDLNLDALKTASHAFRFERFARSVLRLPRHAAPTLGPSRRCWPASTYTPAITRRLWLRPPRVYDACSSWFPLTDYTTAGKVQGAVKLYDDIIFAAYDRYLTKNYNDVMLSNQNNFILALRNPMKRFTATEQKYDVRYKYCVNLPDAEEQEGCLHVVQVREIYRLLVPTTIPAIRRGRSFL